MLVALFLLLAGALVWGASRQKALRTAKAKLADYSARYQPAMNVDAHVRLGEKRVEELLQQEQKLSDEMEVKRQRLQEQYDSTNNRLKAEIESVEKSLYRINEELALASDAAFLAEIGYYEPRYDFEDVPSYEAELKKIRDRQKDMLRADGTSNNSAAAAAYITSELTFNGSTAQGRSAQKRIIKLMLRAFNGESDSFIARVNYRNMEAMERRIENAFEAINKITDKYYSCVLNPKYLSLRLQELELVYEWEEAKQREKEEQARIREQMREEERAEKEAERAQQQAEKEEKKFQELLAKAEKEAMQASEKDKEKLASKIEELQKRIAEIEEKKRAISQAMLTKTGHVYIISNIGSFGADVYKIGMTRRLEPMDRVKELGDASVPFPFDVHAMIRTSDAPALENALHRHFDQRRLNLENQRKEFFRVSIEEIQDELKLLKEQLGLESELRLTLLADAKQFRMSEAKRKHLEATFRSNEEG